MQRLVLIDGNAILHRAYHAIPPLTSKGGEPVNAVYGLVSMLVKLVNQLKPTHMAVCFDRPEPTFRKVEFAKYQAQRPEIEENLSLQFDKAKDVLRAMNIKIFEKPGYEADDLIGSISNLATEREEFRVDEVIIVTGDRDILQLVDDSKKIRVFMPVGGFSEGKIYTQKDVLERMGVLPERIADYKALVGDPSDNYPGVAGIGPKTAVKLISEFGGWEEIKKSLDKIDEGLKNKIQGNLESGDLSYRLAKIVTNLKIDINLSRLNDWNLSSEEARNILEQLGFRSLLKRISNSYVSMDQVAKNNVQFSKKLAKEEVEEAVYNFSRRMDGKKFAVRGTASLVLQGYDMGVDDIDVVCDEQTVEFIKKEFKNEIIKEINYSKSSRYQSFFGQMVLGGVLFEVMGNFQYRNQNGVWSGVLTGEDSQVNVVKVKGREVRVTKPEVEMEFAAGMGRWNEYHKIRRQIQERMQGDLF